MSSGAWLTGDNLPCLACIEEVIVESPRVKTFVLNVKLKAGPGQFVMLWLPGVDEKPFSLVDSAPVTLTVARVGPFTTQLHRMGPGERVWLRGPLGNGFKLMGKRLLLVGGGYGVAPLAFLARRAREEGRQVTVVIGAQTKSDLVLVERFSALGCRVIAATEDGSAGVRGLAPQVAEGLLDEEGAEVVYACGPEGMLEAVKELCRRRGLPAQLSYEGYMRCGMGVCGSCQRAGWLVCRDGPVAFFKPSRGLIHPSIRPPES